MSIVLSSDKDDMPKITEYDHALWYSSIYTPDVQIDYIQSNCVNGFWPLPSGLADLIQRRLEQMNNWLFETSPFASLRTLTPTHFFITLRL
ncbi:MAG: hypothetical protein IH585_09940 [Anaerolineaceae bacterium]|nr:hypothetical protein [Anaerolineaceae bacterium]